MSLVSKHLSHGLAFLLVAAVIGCAKREAIARYSVPKPELIDPTPVSSATQPAANVEQQTLGAITVAGDMGWFFKLTGEPRSVEPQREAFVTFLKSVRFSTGPDAKPSWSLPEGWKELPGSGMRFATIQVPASGSADGKLELTVIPLPKTESDTQRFLLDNINRWRGQLRLKPIAADELARTSETLKVGEHEYTFVSLVGVGGGGMAAGPFVPPSSGAATPRAGGDKKSAQSDVVYDAPPQWRPGTPNQFSIAAFAATDGDKRVDITLSSAGGDLLANVNRWRGQVGLSPISAADLASSVTKIDTLGVEGDYVELVGSDRVSPPKTILAVMAVAGGRTWFVKLIGDQELAAKEKPRFEAFVKSLKLK